MAKVTNISNGPRGAYNEGVLVMADPGETIEADDFASRTARRPRTSARPTKKLPA
jgi:hypothetical protein